MPTPQGRHSLIQQKVEARSSPRKPTPPCSRAVWAQPATPSWSRRRWGVWAYWPPPTPCRVEARSRKANPPRPCSRAAEGRAFSTATVSTLCSFILYDCTAVHCPAENCKLCDCTAPRLFTERLSSVTSQKVNLEAAWIPLGELWTTKGPPWSLLACQRPW